MADPDPNYSLDQYITQLRNTVHAAYEDGYDRTEIHNRFEGLLFELREDHRPRIDTPDEFRTELDLFLRDAYLPTDQVIDVLEAKIEELDGIGEEIGEGQSSADEVLPVDGDEAPSSDGVDLPPPDRDEMPPPDRDEMPPADRDGMAPSDEPEETE